MNFKSTLSSLSTLSLCLIIIGCGNSVDQLSKDSDTHKHFDGAWVKNHRRTEFFVGKNKIKLDRGFSSRTNRNQSLLDWSDEILDIRDSKISRLQKMSGLVQQKMTEHLQSKSLAQIKEILTKARDKTLKNPSNETLSEISREIDELKTQQSNLLWFHPSEKKALVVNNYGNLPADAIFNSLTLENFNEPRTENHFLMSINDDAQLEISTSGIDGSIFTFVYQRISKKDLEEAAQRDDFFASQDFKRNYPELDFRN